MNRARVADIHRKLAELHRELAEEITRDGANDSDEWIDQNGSPLGKRKHLELVRDGVLRGRKPDRRRVLVRRTDIEAYLDAHPARATLAAAPSPGEAVGQSPERAAAKLRAELGLVRKA